MLKKAPLYSDRSTFTNFLSRFPHTICFPYTFTNPLNTFSILIKNILYPTLNRQFHALTCNNKYLI